VVIARTTSGIALSSQKRFCKETDRLWICRRFIITCYRSRRGFSICKVTTVFEGVPHRRVWLSAHLDRLDVILRPRGVCAHSQIHLFRIHQSRRVTHVGTLGTFSVMSPAILASIIRIHLPEITLYTGRLYPSELGALITLLSV